MILNDVIEIRAVIEEYLDLDLNIKTAYKFMKFFQETENDYNFFVQKTQEIINKYAEKDENNQIITEQEGVKINKNFIEQAQQELMNLSLIEINIGDYFYFNINELENLKMSCRKMRLFIPYIKD